MFSTLGSISSYARRQNRILRAKLYVFSQLEMSIGRRFHLFYVCFAWASHYIERGRERKLCIVLFLFVFLLVLSFYLCLFLVLFYCCCCFCLLLKLIVVSCLFFLLSLVCFSVHCCLTTKTMFSNTKKRQASETWTRTCSGQKCSSKIRSKKKTKNVLKMLYVGNAVKKYRSKFRFKKMC